jgi:hypothetical protein
VIHVDVKKVGRIPDGGGWRVHGRGSDAHRAVDRAKTKGAKAGYVYLHSAVDGFSRLAYTEPLANETGTTAIGFFARARAFFAAHGIHRITRMITDNGSCPRQGVHPIAVRRRPPPADQAVHPATQRQGRALPADPGRGTPLRPPLDIRSPGGRGDQHLGSARQLPPTAHRRRKPTTASRLHTGVTNVMTSNTYPAAVCAPATGRAARTIALALTGRVAQLGQPAAQDCAVCAEATHPRNAVSRAS